MHSWMYKNKLQLNDAKTEVMLISSVHNQSKFNVSHIQGCDSEIQPVSVVRNIGAQLDDTLIIWSHVNSLCSRAHFYLRNISKIRHLLDRRTIAALVHAYVTSRLDNGNPLLCGLPQTLISKVQRIQTAGARLMCLTGRREHITPILQELHWLPACPSADFFQHANADIPGHCMGPHLSTWLIYFPGTSQQDLYAPAFELFD